MSKKEKHFSNNELWLEDFKNANSLADGLVERLQKLEGPPLGHDAARIRGELARLTTGIEHLEKSLMTMSTNPGAYDISRRELSRRGDLLSQLSGTKDEIEDSMTGRITPQAWTAPSSRPLPTQIPPSQSQSYADQIIEEQDETLDYLEASVSNMKNIGQEVHREVDLHSRLLGDVEDQADLNRIKMKAQMQRMSKIFNQNTSECCLWTVIFVLICLNVIVGIFL